MASKEALRKTYLATLQRWPKDILRPECQLQGVLSKRLAESAKYPGQDQDQDSAARQVNALVSLLTNRYTAKYAVAGEDSRTGGMLTPRSNPTYYEDLMKELEDVPTRTWAQRVGLKMKGMFRWQ